MNRLRTVIALARAMLSAKVRDRDFQIAAGIALASVLLLALTATQGFVRDEGYYFRAARDYHRWFEYLWQQLLAGDPWVAFGDPALVKHFGYNTEHPGLVKLLMGWTWKVFHGWLGLTSHATGYRLGAILLVALGNGTLYLLGRHIFSRAVGVLAVVLLMACPHVFYHSHLACFDGPIVGLTVLATYGFLRSFDSKPWLLGAGIAWGLAIATKHNAAFLIPTFGIAYAIARVREFRWRDGALTLPPLPLAFVCMAALAPIIFYALYPYGWHAPFERIGAYYNYHLHHEHYPVDYLGTLLYEPPFPFSFPFVMSALTIPLPVLGLGIAGLIASAHSAWVAARAGNHERALPHSLLVLSTITPPLVIAMPTVPIFGGTKHWMPMMPFLCLLGAAVLWKSVRHAQALEPKLRLAAFAACALALIVPIADTARTQPVGHTYFNELAGGYQGGAALGMPRTFWGGDGRELLGVLNEQAEQNARVFTDRMNQDDFLAYKRDGLLRQDLRWVQKVRSATWAMVNHQREHLDDELEVWLLNGHRTPVASFGRDGVPLVTLYRLGDSGTARKSDPGQSPR